MQRNKIIDLLNDIEALEFIRLHRDEAPDSLALKHSGKVSFDLIQATQILHLYHKAESKMPLWSEKLCAFTSRSYEQASSQRVARYKAGLFVGGKLVDLTAGLGVDSAFFSKSFRFVTSVEQNEELYQLSNFNLNRLEITNVECVHASAEHFINSLSSPVDLFYVDPDRRSVDGKRQILLEEHQPNIIDIKEKLFRHSNQILVKLSPMADITYLKKALPETTDIWVISEHNEVKEILVLLKKVDSKTQKVCIHAVDLAKEDKEFFVTGDSNNVPKLCNDQSFAFLFEPAKAVIKAGLSQTYAHQIGVSGISTLSHYYLSESHIPNTMGRWFEIEETLNVQWKQLKIYLKKQGITQIQIAKRDFPESTEMIRNRLRISDGGNRMLLFTTDHQGKKKCFLVKRILPN